MYSSASSTEMQMLPRAYELTDVSEPYWQVHFLNAPGLTLSDMLMEDCEALLLEWHAYITLQKDVCGFLILKCGKVNILKLIILRT